MAGRDRFVLAGGALGTPQRYLKLAPGVLDHLTIPFSVFERFGTEKGDA